MHALRKGSDSYREKTRELDFRRGFAPLPASVALPAKPAHGKSRKGISAPDKGGMLLLLLLAGFVCIGMIIASAWMSSIQYEINQIAKATEATRAEIEKLSVRIEKETRISLIELRAVRELGMIYPTADRVVYIEAEPAPVNDFAQYIKESAYRLWQ
ncbi:MAG: hypothetical protein LBD95_06075 [Clostridiales Family XIII bacterium]|jgi:cell division protein FtsL|nr:hypothetical protein [Clostridiales Family XIII bacterium]